MKITFRSYDVVAIMSVYKNDKLTYLKEALNSLYNQTFTKFDIFIQCDGELPKALEKFLDSEYENGRIKQLNKRTQNMGLAYSLNELIKIGIKNKYKYFIRMDADDISQCERVEKQYKFMEQNNDLDVSGTYIKEFSDSFLYDKIIYYPLRHDDLFQFFKKRVPVAHVSAIFRNTFFRKAGLYDTENHISNEDTLMWMKGFKANCKFANLDYIGVKVRVTSDFFDRRSGFEKVISDFNNRRKVIQILNYGLVSYFYAIVMVLINLLPASFKKVAYKFFR